MTYTVITKNGIVHVFTMKEMVDIYLAAYGGVVFTQQILEQKQPVDQ
jgi:hypothetical protein